MTTKKNATEEVVVEEQEQKQPKFNDEMTIVLWKNERADNDNNQPSVRGQCTIGGVKYYVSCWTLVDKNKKTFLRGKIQKAGEYTNQAKLDLFD